MRWRHHGRLFVIIWPTSRIVNSQQTPRVTQGPNASDTVWRLPGSPVIWVAIISEGVDIVAVVPGLIRVMGLVPESVNEEDTASFAPANQTWTTRRSRCRSVR